MAGNKSIYDTAMKRAHEYAWANQWERALKEYERALAEFPNDRTAERNLAQCRFRLRQWPQALKAYENLLSTDPTDAFALNRVAEIYLALGQQDRARAGYDRLADLYVENGQVHEAIRALRDLARAMPKSKDVHNRLLDLATEIGDGPAQAAEHLALSQIALDAANLGEAQQHADAAATLDSENPDIRRWVYTVRRRLAESAGTVSLAEGFENEERAPAAIGTHLLRDEFEPPQVAQIVARAEKASDDGDYKAALDLYDQAVRGGAKRTAIFYSAGVLNHQMGRPEQAIALLERALQDPEFAMSANYVLGQCHATLRHYAKAVLAFERALTLIELDKLGRTEADELMELYKAAAEANLADNNPGRAASLYSTLVSTFKQRKWHHPKLSELEKKADELYNRSILSKLEGISRGSAMLDPETLTASLPVAEPEGTNRLAAASPEAATTQLPGANGHGRRTTDDGRRMTDNGSGPLPAVLATPTERSTSVMPSPGSNLRSITEYLRAQVVEVGQGSVLRPPAPGGEADGTKKLPKSVPTELLPQGVVPTGAAPSGTNSGGLALPDTVLAGKQQQDVAVQVIIAEGEHAMSEYKWDAAIDACLNVIGMKPDYLPIHMMLGDIYLHQGKVEDAVAKYQTVMDTYIARRDPEYAALVCERLLQLQPDNPSLQTRLGLLFMEAGRVDDAARALLVAADRYHQQGDTQRALEEALNLKAQMPNSSEVALAVGSYQMGLGQDSEAVVELSRALQLNPGNDSALIRLYSCLVKMADPTQWDALQSVLERSSADSADTRLFMEELHGAMKKVKSPELHYALAVITGRAGLDDIAADALDQGILFVSLAEEQPQDGSWHLTEALMAQLRADMAINAKEWGLAVRHYSRALELSNYELRITNYESGTTDDGTVRYAQDKLTTDDGKPGLESPRPQYDFLRLAEPVQLYYGLAEAHASQNNWDGALQALKALKKLIPDDHGVHTRLADIYFRQGNLTEALAELNDLLVTYQKGNDNEKTLETLKHMARLAPNNVAVRRKLSDLYLKLGMTEYGLTELNTLAELQLKAGLLKDAMRSYQKAADLHYTLGQHDKAIGIYERIVRIAPRDLSARDQLINMYIMSGKVKEAIASERALADLFIQEGRTEEAIAALHQLLALAAEDVEGHHLLAKQLTAMGEYGQAARLYGRLVRLDPENDRVPMLHQEMQRMADEAEKEAAKRKAEAKKEGKKARTAPANV